jgi:pimeloyl-ACP methyl ester carboxylesterase
MTRFVDATPLERLLAVALLLVLALCSGGAWAESSAEEQLSYRPSSIAWAARPEFSSLECGVLQLPMDYRQPGGQTFGMAVIRARATHPQQRIGVLLTNPGGPGVSVVNSLIGGIALKALILSRLRERFDIISFDPRGVERSHAVRCPVPYGDVPAAANGAAVAAHFDDLGRRYAAGCAQQSGPFVFTLSMNNIARDMEMLRRSLGEPQIGYVGLSFGTQLGAVYASMFPQRLRALLLDASISPETGGDALQDFWVEHSAAFEAGFRRRCMPHSGTTTHRSRNCLQP